MRVVYVCTLDRGGPLSHIEDLAPSVAAEGVDVLVVCATNDSAKRLRARGVEAVVAPVRNKIDIRGAARIWPLLKDADVVHTHDRRAGLLARLQAPVRRAKAVHTFHGVPNELFGEVGRNGPPERSREASRLRIAWLRHGLLRMEAMLSYTGTVIVPSRALLEYVVRHGFPSRRLHHIPYGVERRRDKPAARHAPPRIGTAAVLEHRKGVDVLIEASTRMVTAHELHVFGDGTRRQELEEHARRAGIDARFHGFRPDARERLQELDVFVLPTRGDNLPVAIMEAMAYALPVVATRIGGNPELVEDSSTGRLVPVDDPVAMAEAIEWTLSDEERRRELGARGAILLAERFDPSVIARRVVDLYEELCASST
jgi:glycosyltransferase involved in cell wall biosynthesis